MWIYVLDDRGRLTWDRFTVPTAAALIQFIRSIPDSSRIFVRQY